MSQEILLNLVQRHLNDYCDVKRKELLEISEDLGPIMDFTQDLLEGGKRFRALFAFWAWAGQRAEPVEPEDLKAEDPIIAVASALEMFHAAALVHDDLLDQSDTRRGKPAIHKRFEVLHKNHGYAGTHERFGVAGSVLVGDMMLSWSSELFGEALLHSIGEDAEARCRSEFSKMRFEVMAGQYLDVLEENAAPMREKSEAVARANRVMLYKTAKYSLEAPLLIGAALAGAGADKLKGLSDFGIPLGMAFQLRDDILGVFGDPAVTGKPAGDDLREGKRTVLTGLTLEALPTSVANIFEELLTSGEIDESQLAFMRESIEESGALAKTEKLIQEYSDRAIAALAELEISDQGREMLARLTEAVIKRSK
ncbi:polyprenyl synthetase family protein [Aquiluna borgnonia]|uniref:Polyprenyl synthetase family protein n=1 Tax=Aquiluna borgnonia TaxID=2499157 RepID=A0A7D4TUB2_9MICO|nr:polyprenyl synthetase family protein [Aquiluna borgnonia]QKJ25395.1 polyprenyl synthetase family protein [Aquiluna borgnonia]